MCGYFLTENQVKHNLPGAVVPRPGSGQQLISITFSSMGLMMEKNDLKKLLAGLSLVALVGATGLSVTGCATTGSTARAGDAEIDVSERDNTDGNLSG